MRISLWLCAVGALLATCALTASGDEAVDLKVGEAAPAFEAPDDAGKPWKSSEHVGKKVLVIYFYPGDLTGGCTKQACAYRDDLKELTDAGAEIVGVSGDSVETHQLFKKAHSLNFTLLADPDGTVAKAFGVPATAGDKLVDAVVDGVSKQIVRKNTAKRWTFVIDKAGKIVHKNTSVVAPEDSKAILEVIKKLPQK
jgi:peroxiredoxin Q/BCP